MCFGVLILFGEWGGVDIMILLVGGFIFRKRCCEWGKVFLVW